MHACYLKLLEHLYLSSLFFFLVFFFVFFFFFFFFFRSFVHWVQAHNLSCFFDVVVAYPPTFRKHLIYAVETKTKPGEKKRQAKVQAYADGVNAYLDSKPTLPIEFRLLGVNPSPWKPADSIVWAKLMSLSLSGNMNTELLRFMLMTERGASLAKVNELLPPFDTVQFPTVLQPADVCPGGAAAGANYSQHCNNSKAAAWLNPLRSQRQQARQRRSSNGSSLLPNKQSAEHALPQFFRRMDEGGMIRGASNNWVVHGNRTAAGKPLLCNDPHLDLTAPSIWILSDVQVPGVYGAIGTCAYVNVRVCTCTYEYLRVRVCYCYGQGAQTTSTYTKAVLLVSPRDSEVVLCYSVYADVHNIL